MTKDKWEKLIKSQCLEANTYKPYFDSVIETLAQIMAARDVAYEQWVKEGCKATVINYTDRSNKANTHKNPLLSLINEHNALALKYWSELGLTASSFKKLNVQKDDGGNLEDLLKKISG